MSCACRLAETGHLGSAPGQRARAQWTKAVVLACEREGERLAPWAAPLVSWVAQTGRCPPRLPQQLSWPHS